MQGKGADEKSRCFPYLFSQISILKTCRSLMVWGGVRRVFQDCDVTCSCWKRYFYVTSGSGVIVTTSLQAVLRPPALSKEFSFKELKRQAGSLFRFPSMGLTVDPNLFSASVEFLGYIVYYNSIDKGVLLKYWLLIIDQFFLRNHMSYDTNIQRT